MCGVYVGHVCGVCVACVWLCGVCGVCVGACGGMCCVCVLGCGGRGEVKVSLAPLYYPDTLVNPDTCLVSLTLELF